MGKKRDKAKIYPGVFQTPCISETRLTSVSHLAPRHDLLFPLCNLESRHSEPRRVIISRAHMAIRRALKEKKKISIRYLGNEDVRERNNS